MRLTEGYIENILLLYLPQTIQEKCSSSCQISQNVKKTIYCFEIICKILGSESPQKTNLLFVGTKKKGGGQLDAEKRVNVICSICA